MADPPAAGAQRNAGAFAAAAGQGRAALMPYMMGGFPDRETSVAVAEAYADSGADLVELGIPYSDPLADGPVIHAAGTRALEAGATLDSVLELCERLAARVPVVPMAYANMALARGPAAFARALSDAGACAVIVPDLPPEESGEVGEELRAAGLSLIPLVAPTTPDDRRASICAAAEGFVYLVSDTRTTGERDSLPTALAPLVEATRAASAVPVAVGFGIGTPAQAAEVGRVADGVIIGSRLVRAVSEAPDAAAAARSVSSFITDCRRLMSEGGAATPAASLRR
jgi:tryptophan synthase alpha chain